MRGALFIREHIMTGVMQCKDSAARPGSTFAAVIDCIRRLRLTVSEALERSTLRTAPLEHDSDRMASPPQLHDGRERQSDYHLPVAEPGRDQGVP